MSDCTERVNGFPEGLCIIEGKVGEGFVLVISISIWNHMHIGSVPWYNEFLIVHLGDMWRTIVALDIGCSFDFAVDFGLPRKVVDPN